MSAGGRRGGTRGGRPARDSAELRRLREQIDALDRRIVQQLNERAQLTIKVGHEKVVIGRRFIRDREREREVLLRVSIANEGPMPQADLIAVYRRLIAASRALEAREREKLLTGEHGPAEPPGA